MTDKKLAPQLKPYHFKKNQSGNPNGARNYHNRRRAVREVSTESLQRISEALFLGDIKGLEELARDPSITPIEKLVIAVVLKAVQKGDANAMDTILSRFVGKPVQNVNVNALHANVQTDINDFRSLTDDEILRRRELLVKAKE